jgi:hypothetical protein
LDRFLAFLACQRRDRLPLFPNPLGAEADEMSEELWYVKLANGDVHRVTLDQLDGAFQAGHIDEGTMVLAAGASIWTKLGDLAGLDDEAEAPAPAPVSYAAPVAPTAPTRAVPVTAPSAYPAPAVAYAPVPTYVPRAVAAPAVAPAAYVPNSLRPMSLDLSDDLDMPLPPSRKGRFFVAVIGLAAVAGAIGFAAQRINIPGGTDIASVAAAAAMAPPPPAADPIVQAPPTPAALPAAAPIGASAAATPAAAAEGSPLNPQFTTRFNEDTKQKLVAADKTRDAKSKARHGGAHAAPHSKSQSVFTTGGNKYDPLNSSI